MYDHSTPPIVALVAQQVYRIIRFDTNKNGQSWWEETQLPALLLLAH